jgi:transposase InsO family protein
VGRGSPRNNPRFYRCNQLHQVHSFHFGVPHNIITENGTNFTSKEFKSYCESMGIKLIFASVAHPKTNGQVEKANGLICNGIKKRLLAPLEKAKHAWVDELPSVL